MTHRQAVERRIVEAIVDDVLAAGHSLSVSLERGWDIDEMLRDSTERETILAAAFAGGDCHIFIHNQGEPIIIDGSVNNVGWIYLVFGNDGWDVISDYSMGIEPLLKRANVIADEEEARCNA